MTRKHLVKGVSITRNILKGSIFDTNKFNKNRTYDVKIFGK